MPNKRSSGQKLIGFWADETYADAIDAARGSKPKSEFLRDAMAEYLSGKVDMTHVKTTAPDRAGVGRPKKATYKLSDAAKKAVANATRKSKAAAKKRSKSSSAEDASE